MSNNMLTIVTAIGFLIEQSRRKRPPAADAQPAFLTKGLHFSRRVCASGLCM